MLKQNITIMMLSFSVAANATVVNSNSLNTNSYSYNSHCAQASCFYNDSLSYNNTPSYSLTTLNLDADSSSLPQYLIPHDTKDWNYLRNQTYTVLGLSVVTVGLMTFLPESITKWEKREDNQLLKKWKDNVLSGPTWDRDEHYLNYIMHPYFGGVYYTAARHSGFNQFESFIYSGVMSTFFWEMGVEAFAEVPSWQDLFITPFFGAVVGELMFTAELHIVENNRELLGSRALANTSLFFLNPVGHIHEWVSGGWGGNASLQFSNNPWLNNTTAAQFAADAGASYGSPYYGVNLTISF